MRSTGRKAEIDGVGTGRAQNASVSLWQLINLLNARFGTEFLPADRLFFDQIVETTILNA